MDLLERYLQAVGQHLSPETRDDMLAELRVNLLAEMDARAEELERPLTESEVAALLQAHGRPILVAARYSPQRYLIGPAVFPIYMLTLRKAAPFVVFGYLVARASTIIFSKNAGGLGANIAGGLVQLIPVLLLFWAVATMTFAILEFAQKQYGECTNWEAWDPATLPSLTRPKKEKSLASRIADLVVHCFWMLYVFAIPRHPFLVIGPGVLVLNKLSAGFAPIWHVFYVALVVLLLAQLGVKLTALSRRADRWIPPLELLTKLLSVVTTGVLAFTKVYFVPTSPAANLHALAGINNGLNLSFRILLVVVALGLLVEVWKFLRPMIPVERLAF
jgi:hypothetical protein